MIPELLATISAYSLNIVAFPTRPGFLILTYMILEQKEKNKRKEQKEKNKKKRTKEKNYSITGCYYISLKNLDLQYIVLISQVITEMLLLDLF